MLRHYADCMGWAACGVKKKMPHKQLTYVPRLVTCGACMHTKVWLSMMTPEDGPES